MTKYVNENGICYVKAESVRHLVYGPVAKCLQQQADEIEKLRMTCDGLTRKVDLEINRKISALETINLLKNPWISVEDRLPELDTPVIVISKHNPKRIYCAMRYDDGEFWTWGQMSGYNACLNDTDSYEFDDDYDYIKWMPLPEPPEQND